MTTGLPSRRVFCRLVKTFRPLGAVMSSVSMQVLSPAEVRYISASPSTSALVTEFWRTSTPSEPRWSGETAVFPVRISSASR